VESIFGGILLFLAITILAALLFVGWLIMLIVRAVFGVLAGVGRMVLPRHGLAQHEQQRSCGYARCRAPNPLTARYCRRCGRALAEVEQVVARRAAVL
jgi:hypothetical protein